MAFLLTTHPAHSQTNFSAATPAECSIDALFTETPIVMDGLLSEPVWNQAVPADGFIQREPREGEPATEKTEVRVLYDDLNLYIGVLCRDSEPGHIVHTELRFDGNLADDDNFTFILDTFADQRNGFYFCINPNGARQDARIGGRFGTALNYDWNGVWDTAALITDEGWSAEIVIPFATLRFSEVEMQSWGVNFRRVIARKNEEVLWSAWSRDDGITQLSRAGMLCNLKSIKRGRLLEVKPYLLGGFEEDDGTSDDEFKYGVDVKYPLTSDLTLDLTTYTDFAQIEADRTQINLTRFDLRYPEQRDFFLEGAEIFDFGGSQATPYYSRRIGLTPDRKAVPLVAGAKVTGKAGKYNLGVFDIQTDDMDSTPSTNYSVVRIKRDVLQKSSVGVIATNVHDETGHWDRTFGADFSYRTDRFLGNKNFAINTDYSENFKDDSSTGRNAYFQIQYPNDRLNMIAYHKQVGKNYAPETGFVEKSGIQKTDVRVTFMPRPNLPHIRQLRLPYRFLLYADTSGRPFWRQIMLTPIGFRTTREDTFTLSLNQRYEYLYAPFRIFRDVMIPAGSYDWWEGVASIGTNQNRPLSTNFSLQLGDFFNGTKKTVDSTLITKFSQYLSLEGQIIYNDLAVGNESFSTREYSMRVNTNVSPRLDIRTFIQYNNDDELVNLNFRIHFIPRVGSDIYFVYNHLWDGSRDYETTYDATLAKIDWRFEF